MSPVEITTARGTRLAASLAGDSVTVLYRGRPLASMPLEALQTRKAGLHLNRDSDPRFWLDIETLRLLLTILAGT